MCPWPMPSYTSQLHDLSDRFKDPCVTWLSQRHARRFLLGMLQQEEDLFFFPGRCECGMRCSNHLCHHRSIGLQHAMAWRQRLKPLEQKSMWKTEKPSQMVSFDLWIQYCPTMFARLFKALLPLHPLLKKSKYIWAGLTTDKGRPNGQNMERLCPLRADATAFSPCS